MSYFADTVYLLALLNARDQYHERALGWAAFVGTSRVVTTHWVLTELLDALQTAPWRQRALQCIAQLESDPTAHIIAASNEWFHAGLSLYEGRDDKEWSLTDCISFVVMQREGLRDALTADHHFTQAGFRAMLLTDPPA